MCQPVTCFFIMEYFQTFRHKMNYIYENNFSVHIEKTKKFMKNCCYSETYNRHKKHG